LEIPVAKNHFGGAGDVEALVAEFHRVHDRVFAVRDEGQAVECLNWRGRLIARVNPPALEPPRRKGEQAAQAERRRQAYFAGGLVDTPIFLGDQLNVGAVIEGPAIIEEPTSTLVVYPGSVANVSAGGRYILTPPEEAEL
jgi:N-methylhydantoinase A